MKIKQKQSKKTDHLFIIGTGKCFKNNDFNIKLPTEVENYASFLMQTKPKETIIKSNYFNTDKCETAYLCIIEPKTPITDLKIANFIGKLSQQLSSKKGHLHIVLSKALISTVSKTIDQTIMTSLILATYSQKSTALLPDLSVSLNIPSTLLKSTEEQYFILGKNINLAKQLMNMPSNKLTPKEFVSLFKQHSKHLDIDSHIHTKSMLEKQNMMGILNVAKGSIQSPFLIEAHYKGNKSKKINSIIIGKGVTFDSGGISIKPSRGMANMKADMGGAAVALASFLSLVEQKTTKNISLLLPIVENMPSGEALKPGDVISSYSKKTIEIINTDAEGRLILADCLAYASDKKPNEIIDIATLTGACSIALGDQASAILGTNNAHIKRMIEIGEQTGERLWQLPLYEEYGQYLKSEVADIKNAHETRLAGTATAAKFLSEFVSCNNWIHIDIASTMMTKKQSGYKSKGMNPENIQNIVRYIQEA